MSSPVIVLQAGFSAAFTTTTNGQTGILQAVGKILFLGIFSSGRGFRQFVGIHHRITFANLLNTNSRAVI
jgi:hypothetical protein